VFQQFTLPQVQHDLGLTLHDANLISSVPPFPVGEEFAAFLSGGVALAVANSTFLLSASTHRVHCSYRFSRIVPVTESMR